MARKKTVVSFTPQETRILSILESGRTVEDVAQELGIARESVEIRLRDMLDTAGDAILERYPSVFMSSKSMDGLDLGADVIKMAREVGISKPMLESLKRRINAKQGLQPADPKALTDRQLINGLEEKIALALSYLDSFALAGASAKDLQAVIDGLISNVQLLKGKPTSITSVEDRRRINELLPLLVLEARKRGVLIEGEFTKIENNGPA